MKNKKYLTESELSSFVSFLDAKKITQKEVSSICCESQVAVSNALTKKRFKRANAKLVVFAKKQERDEEFRDLEF